jgi:hypothetical protein
MVIPFYALYLLYVSVYCNIGDMPNYLINHFRYPFMLHVDENIFEKFKNIVPLDRMTQHLDALVRFYVERPDVRDILVRPKPEKHVFHYDADESFFVEFLKIVPSRKATPILCDLMRWWIDNHEGFEIQHDINKGEHLVLKKLDDSRT